MTDPKKDPRRRCVPFEEWPRPDQEAWNKAIRSGDLLDDTGPAAHWRDGTRQKVQSSYGRWLTFLERQGTLDPIASPETRVTSEVLRAYIDELHEQVSSVTLAGRVTDLSEALRVMAPGHELSFLRRAQQALAVRARPIRNKRQWIVPPASLLHLAIRLMDEAEGNPCPRLAWRACRYRDALMIAMLATRALRRRNFAGIIVGQHLGKIDDRYILLFDGSETKNHRPIEMALPDILTGHIDRYLEVYRPILHGEDRHQEPHSRRATDTQMYVQKGPFAARRSDDEIQQTALYWGHLRSPDHDPTGQIDEGDAGDADTTDIGIDGWPHRRPGKSAALGRDLEQVAQICRLNWFLGHLLAVARGQIQLRRVELKRSVLRQADKLAELLIEPVVPGREAAISNDAEAHLPSAQVALALGIDETENGRNADCCRGGQRKSARNHGDGHASPAPADPLVYCARHASLLT